MRLLIVDDGAYIVEYLRHLLDWKRFGMNEVTGTTNPAEARELLNSNRFDLMITDIRMPEISGIDLLEYIHGRGIKTRVIFLSGYSQFDYAQKAIRFGALDYLLKPVDQSDMEKAITQALHHLRASASPPQPLSVAASSMQEADFASTGIGTAGTDVSMTIEHASHAENRPNSGSGASQSESRAETCGADVVRSVQAYIVDHVGEALSLDDLSRIVHLHPVYLSKLYKQETGENLSGYILRVRLERAVRLLENSDLHIVDIARMVGYRKPQYFIKLFKERYEITPYQYRRNRI